MNEALSAVLARLGNSQRNGAGYKARCPAHDDRNPSLSVSLGDDGRVLVHCHAGCPVEAIVAVLGLEMRDLMPPSTPPKPPPRTFATPEAAAQAFATWQRGTVETIYQWTAGWHRARVKVADGKVFCEITRVEGGWVQRGPLKPHALYRQTEIPADGPIFICEGEKACDAGWSIGLPCVTSGSADSAGNADWQPAADRDVVVVPDNDAPGSKFGLQVAQRLYRLVPPARVKIVELPGLGPGDDMHEFVHELRDGHDAEDIRSEILKLAAATTEFVPSVDSAEPADDWPIPQPLPDELPAVEPFDFSLLPASLRAWIKDIADRIQCPPDFPAIAAMITLATVVGRKLGFRPKRADNWLAVPNLWGAAIGPPSVMKTPAIQEPLKPLKRLELDAKAEFEAEMEEYAAQKLVAEQRAQVGKSAVRDALKSEDGDPLAAAREALQGQEAQPVRRRYLVNDSTVEKLGEILNENPNGVLVYRDELIGLLKSLDKEGQEGARSFYLEAWAGNGRYTYDRIGRGTIDIEAAIFSIIGSIQPGRLRHYLQGAVDGGEDADGLMQRFQLAVYPDISKKWTNVDRWPDTAAKSRAYDTIKALDQLDPAQIGAKTDDEDGDGIPYLRFSSAAQDIFDEWRTELEERIRAKVEHPAMEAHLAKYRSLIPSLALLIHLADGGTGPVGTEGLQAAIRWGRYLESHARRIYATAVAPDTAEAVALAKKIMSGEVKDEFALRDVYRRGWIGLGSLEAAQRAVALLVDLDWLLEIVEKTPGRTKTYYRINPKITPDLVNRTDKTDKSPQEGGA